MNHLQRNALQKWQRFNHGLIDSARALAASHHEHRRADLPESEFLTRHPSIQTFQLGSDRRAGDFCVGFWKKRRAFLEAKHDRAHHSCGQSVRFPGDGV